MEDTFVHLRLHTEFSLQDSLIRVDDLLAEVAHQGMIAVAITDQCNLFAAVKFYKAALASKIKPIFGCDLECITSGKSSLEKPVNITFLCQNNQGYRNLTRLISRAYQEGQSQGKPYVRYDWIPEYSDGLLVLSGGRQGDVGQALLAGNELGAKERALWWKKYFPERFYLEIQRTDRVGEALYNDHLLSMACDLSLPIVATNDVRFIHQDDFDAHEARICIHGGYVLPDTKRPRLYSNQQYLRSVDEMMTLFADLPQALQNTVEIAKRCTITLELGHHYLPNFVTPTGVPVEDYLAESANSGLNKRLAKMRTEVLRDPYDERLVRELSVINSMGFSSYFLIVADFIQWAKENDVPVGPGRGSGAGSLVAYALGITDLDPLQYELLFERFLNPERVSMPDFDIDFCMDGRDRVIEYVAEKYGRDSVSQIITFGTMAAKAVVRDVGRVLGHPYGFVDTLAKLIPFELGITLAVALEREEVLRKRYEEEEDVKELIDLALTLEGLTRNAGKHAGGVVIAPSSLTDFTPVYCEENATQWISQFDKDDVEAVGLVKFDFLGLRTLTIINNAIKIINQQHASQNQPCIDINDIPMDDHATFALFQACQTTAVFQLESRGMKELIHRLQPHCFEEIIALVALFRPGPLQSGMVDDFIDRKHGRASVEYLHPDLEQILNSTYGVILYQEQVMQIAQVLASYTLGGADLLRRAMGKKKPEEMAKQRTTFVSGAIARGVNSEIAATIFDLMEKFAGYGFNKSHSAAYALIAYQTAWLKAHYPAAFMAAVLSADMDNTEKVVILLEECAQMKLIVKPPTIQQSHYGFTVLNEHTLLYGLGAIKGVGESAIQSLVEERDANGPFNDLFDFCCRLDSRKFNRRTLDALIKSGSMDNWQKSRAVLLASMDKALQMSVRFHHNQHSGQGDLFGLLTDDASPHDVYMVSAPWSHREVLEAEKETLGFYLTGHPSDIYLEEMKSLLQPISALNPLKMKKSLVCGLIVAIKRIITKRGKTLGILSLEDATGRVDVIVFSELLALYEPVLVIGAIVVVDGELGHDDYNGRNKITAQTVYRIDEVRTRYAKCLTLGLKPEDNAVLPALTRILSENTGNCAVQISYNNTTAQATLNLPQQWFVTPSDALLMALSELLDQKRVNITYQ